MSLHKTEKSLKELHRKLEEEQKLRELPGLVAEIEDALCEQDMAAEERLATIEDIKMDKIWANRLIAGTKTWAEMPTRRHAGVKAELAKRVAEGEITGEDYNE